MAKGYAQKEGIDYNEIFSPVVKHSSIRILLALVAQFNLELVQLDVKVAFLHGNLEEEIYMLQSVGFRVVEQQHLVCRLNNNICILIVNLIIVCIIGVSMMDHLSLCSYMLMIC